MGTVVAALPEASRYYHHLFGCHCRLLTGDTADYQSALRWQGHEAPWAA